MVVSVFQSEPLLNNLHLKYPSRCVSGSLAKEASQTDVREEKNIIFCNLEHIKAKKGFNFSFCSDIFVSEGREMHFH